MAPHLIQILKLINIELHIILPFSIYMTNEKQNTRIFSKENS